MPDKNHWRNMAFSGRVRLRYIGSIFELTMLCSYDMLGINRIATIGCLIDRIIGKTVKSRCSPRYRMADCLRQYATEAKLWEGVLNGLTPSR
jgi:hypothetical protein